MTLSVSNPHPQKGEKMKQTNRHEIKLTIIIAIILTTIFTLSLILTACGSHSIEKAETEITDEHSYMKYVGYNDIAYSDCRIHYFEDRATHNMYIQYGSKGGMSPLYDKNGQIMKYEEWKQHTKEFDVIIYD